MPYSFSIKLKCALFQCQKIELCLIPMSHFELCLSGLVQWTSFDFPPFLTPLPLVHFLSTLSYTLLKRPSTSPDPPFTIVSRLALTENRLFSRQLSGGFLSAFSHQPKKSRFPWEKVKAPSLDLKILQVFFKNRGEILVFQKMLNFLSFLVLLYVSGRFKQKKIFQNFSDW